jgi:hypothetical protein
MGDGPDKLSLENNEILYRQHDNNILIYINSIIRARFEYR